MKELWHLEATRSGAHQIMKTSWGRLNLLQSSTHLEKHKNEKVHITYLSKTVYEELIENVKNEIVNQINNEILLYYCSLYA